MVTLYKKIIFKSYVIFLMGFTVWYGYFMYPLIFGFQGKQEAEISLKKLGGAGTEEEQLFINLIASQTQSDTTDLGYKRIDQPYIEGRFHHIGFEIEQDKFNICVRCHGNTPHSKAKDVRSFLNMHAFYTACETCHIRPGKDTNNLAFRWYEKQSGDITGNPLTLINIEKSYTQDDSRHFYPTYGDYGAKIAPGTMNGNQFEFLRTEKDRNFVELYLNQEKTLSSQQKSQMKRVIHKDIKEKPVECNFCHQPNNPYLPFAELGYPPRRIDELVNTSVVGMIDKYKQFYIPDFLTPAGE